DDHFVPGVLQRPSRMTADVSRPADDQNDHVNSLSTRAALRTQNSINCVPHGCNNVHICCRLPKAGAPRELYGVACRSSTSAIPSGFNDRSKPASNLLYKLHPMT